MLSLCERSADWLVGRRWLRAGRMAGQVCAVETIDPSPSGSRMHEFTGETAALAQAVVDYALDRVRMDPPLDAPMSADRLRAAAGETITREGVGAPEALRVFAEVLAPACISVDHPRFLSFVPAAPTDASVLFDLLVGASSVCAVSWLDASGAVFAENEALAWVASLAGFPASSGGVFVSGGTAGNLSALVAARWRWRHRMSGDARRERGLIIASAAAHSSIVSAASVMDVDVVGVPSDESGKMTRELLVATLDALSARDRERVFAVVATAGTTNAGSIDDLAAAADVSEKLGSWLHVDAAYGGAALAAPSVRERFRGVERADSFIVDPHKWLFAPFDCCALIYRDPRVAKAAHAQNAEYLDVLHENQDWNPSDYAHHLSRRARGLPFWFSLAVHGTSAYEDAVEQTLTVARQGRDLIVAAPHLELLIEPELSVLVFRRRGWSAAQYQSWSARQLAEGTCFVVPTSWAGESALRLCVVNPRTTVADLAAVFDSLT